MGKHAPGDPEDGRYDRRYALKRLAKLGERLKKRLFPRPNNGDEE